MSARFGSTRFYLTKSSALTILAIASGLLTTPAHATPPGFAYCGASGSYVLMYRSNDNLEELRRLRCGEKVEVLSRSVDYVQVRAIDGRVGWVNGAELSNYPGAPPSKSLGVGDSGARQQAASGGALDNAAIEKMRTQRLGADVIVAKIKSSPCHFDTSPAALQKLKQSGIPDKVILAMVMAPSSSSSAPLTAPKAPEFVDVQVPAGTQIDLELK
jgi:hypothetical protein